MPIRSLVQRQPVRDKKSKNDHSSLEQLHLVIRKTKESEIKMSTLLEPIHKIRETLNSLQNAKFQNDHPY